MTQPLDIVRSAQGLVRRDPGIWFAERAAPISYPEHGNATCLAVEDSSFWFHHRNRCILELVRRYPPDGPLLDVGGGNGFVARGLQQAGIPCVLLEPGIEGALAGHARGVDPVVCARIEDAGFPRASFAAAGLFDVLEHFEDDVGLLSTLRELLRPQAPLFITVPAYQLLFSADDVAAGHFRRYTLGSLGRVLRRAGFAVDQATYIFGLLPLPILLLRTLPSWLGRKPGVDPEQVSADHDRSGTGGAIIDAMLDVEFAILRRGWRLPLGGTCLVAARRT